MSSRSVAVCEVHAVGVLEAGDDLGAVLDFEVGLHDFDVVELALLGGFETAAATVEREVTIVGLDKAVDGGQYRRHGQRLFACEARAPIR